MKRLTICHLYPELMNLYGDRGNVIALTRRVSWHGIEPVVEQVSLGNMDSGQYDIIFMGGGQDREQKQICVDFKNVKGGPLADAVESGVPFLAVCGGYQLLGKYYKTGGGEVLEGIGVLDVWTEAGARRMIGNAVVESDLGGAPRTVVGFENHSGRTFLGGKVRPFGRVLSGYGNNGQDGFEGAVYVNTVGTYLHGSLLPKNPWLTDWFISRAVERRYGETLSVFLDDTIEELAHQAAIKRASRRTV
ncbi:MAG: glutamine amidotransferase [Firmicutes bacterium]|nr:glutamine amidotransferase [Bacillota bacterium]